MVPLSGGIGRFSKGEAVTKAEVKKLDTLVSKVVRAREGGCRWCGKDGDGVVFQAHHSPAKRRYRGTRWEPDNLHKVCKGCNFRSESDNLWNEEMTIKELGAERVDELKFMAQAVKGVNDYELIKLIWR